MVIGPRDDYGNVTAAVINPKLIIPGGGGATGVVPPAGGRIYHAWQWPMIPQIPHCFRPGDTSY